MHALRFRIPVLTILSIGALALAVALSGCGSSDSSDSDGTNAEISGKIYIIGEISGTLADEIEQFFLFRFDYDGVSADAPIFVAASAVQSLSSAMRKGILDTYKNGFPIVVVHGNEVQNNAILAVLGLEQNYKLPAGISYSELFSVDMEKDDHTFMWSMYPPSESVLQPTGSNGPSVYRDNDADQLQRAGIFREWINDDGERLTEATEAYKQDATQALSAAAAADGSDLTQLAQGFVTVQNFSSMGNNYQVSYYVYSCHSFNAVDAKDYDWFYVRQEGMFNASAAYQGKSQIKDFLGIVRQEAAFYYVGDYKMNNWMDQLANSDSGVSLMKSDPQNANNVSQVTSGIDWNIGGSVGFNGAAATGALNFGVTIRNSTTVNVNDCDVANNSGSEVNNAKWTYTFKRPTQTVYIGATLLKDEPPLLSRSSFQPVNQWVWKFAPSVRDGNKNSFRSSLGVPLLYTVTGEMQFLWTATDPKHLVMVDPTWTFDVPLKYPPLLVVTHNVDFGASAQYKSLDINVSRNWTALSNEAWCRVEPSSGTGVNPRVNITVDANASGASRTATVTFKTEDGKGSDTMTVFQAQY